MTKNVKKYIFLKDNLEEEEDEKLQAVIEENLEELYYELDDDEISILEVKGYL